MTSSSTARIAAVSPLSFVAPIEIFNGNPYVYVSAPRAGAIKPGWRKPLPVLIRINGKPAEQPWRINLMPIGKGDFYLYLHGDVRRASDTKVGDTVSVQIMFDAAYRNGPMHPMPSWFRVPLSKNAKAKKGMGRFDSEQKEGGAPLFLVAEIPRRSRPQRRAGHRCALGQKKALHGARLVTHHQPLIFRGVNQQTASQASRRYPRRPPLPALMLFWPICLPVGSPNRLLIGSCGTGLR